MGPQNCGLYHYNGPPHAALPGKTIFAQNQIITMPPYLFELFILPELKMFFKQPIFAKCNTKRKAYNRATKQNFSFFLSLSFSIYSGLLLHLITLIDRQSVGFSSRRNRPAVEAHVCAQHTTSARGKQRS
jgi:hypothetical protein